MSKVNQDAWEHAANLLDPPRIHLDHSRWLRQNLPELYPLPWGPQHTFIFDNLSTEPRGVRAFLGAPRGSGKTTTYKVGVPISCLAHGTHNLICLIDVKQEEASARLEIVRSLLDARPDLREKFPNLEFVNPRMGARRRRGVDTDRELLLRGGRILAIGAGESIRGLLRIDSDGLSVVRPDLVIFDDVETRTQARSKLLTDRLEEWVFAEVCQLAGPPGQEKPMDVIGVGTTLEAQCLADRALNNKGRFRGWRTKRIPAEYETTSKKGVTSRRATWPQGLPMAHLHRLLDPEDELYVGRYTYTREYLLDPERVEGTLWTPDILARAGAPRQPFSPPPLDTIVVSVDPSWGTKGDECGIVVVGLTTKPPHSVRLPHIYVLEDASIRATPSVWGRKVADKYEQYEADFVIAEKNFQAEQVRLVMSTTDPKIPFKLVNASRGKRPRAEPVVALYEQSRVTHVKEFPALETQMLEWSPETSTFSPDRMDALVWAITDLALGRRTGPVSFRSPAKDSIAATNLRVVR